VKTSLAAGIDRPVKQRLVRAARHYPAPEIVHLEDAFRA
jgi:hypothetical protein